MLFGLYTTALAEKIDAKPINPNIPGQESAETPSGIVANFYTFALMVSGLLAFGAIVYGAIKYTVSAGNPSQQSDAKQWITDALWGLLLLVSATLILRTINPDIPKLGLPRLEAIQGTGPLFTGTSSVPLYDPVGTSYGCEFVAAQPMCSYDNSDSLCQDIKDSSGASRCRTPCRVYPRDECALFF